MAGGNVPRNLAAIFQAAGRQYGIPPAVLAGIASVESGLGSNTGPSSAGAVGLMQFLPSTARSLGVNPYDARSAIFGAAKLLVQNGYHQNALRAIGAYNGGIGNPQYGYANQVMAESRRLAGQVSGGGTAGGGGGGAGGLSVSSTYFKGSPGTGQLPLPGTSVTLPTFNQAGYDQAQQAYKLGSVLKMLGSSSPTVGDTGPKLDFQAPSALSALYKAGRISTTAPDPQAFQGYKTVQTSHDATIALQGLAGMGIINTHAGAQGYVNPIPGAVIGRTDMGVDANLRPGAPIRAIGNGRVVQIYPNWFKGQPYLLMQLTSGPQAGKYYYIAEQVSPTVRPGQTVRAGQMIGRYANSGTGLEIGWGTGSSRTLAQATTGYHEGQVTPAGTNFRSFLGGLH